LITEIRAKVKRTGSGPDQSFTLTLVRVGLGHLSYGSGQENWIHVILAFEMRCSIGIYEIYGGAKNDGHEIAGHENGGPNSRT